MIKFVFDASVEMKSVEDSLMLAALAAESVHGRSSVRIDACFRLDPKSRICLIDEGTDVGRTIAHVFLGYLSTEFGEGAFSLRRTNTRGTAPETL